MPKTKEKEPLLPELRFPEFEGEWIHAPLGKHAKILKQRAGDKRYPVMSVETGVGLVSQLEKFGRDISGKSYKNYTVIQKNDFAYNKSATKEFPEGFIAKYDDDAKAAVPNSIFTCFRLSDSVIDHEYLYFQLLNNLHGKWLRKFITVGARAHGALSVNADDLLSLPVPLPSGARSTDEQQKIADCLSSLDELIAARNAKLAALQDHKQGLLQQLFAAPGQTTPHLRFPGFEGEWEGRPLKKLAFYQNGKAYEKDIVEEGKYVVVNSRFVSMEGAVKKFTNAEFCPARSGDVLMVLSDLPKGRALAKCFYVEQDDKYGVNQRVCRLRSKGVNDKFLYYRLNRHHSLLAHDDGITQTHLSKSDVEDCVLWIPKEGAEQQKIADCLSSLDALIAAETGHIAALKQKKRGLMQKLFPNPERRTA